MKTVTEIFASKSQTITATRRTASSILSPPAPASSNQRVNEILGITNTVRAGAPVGNQNAAGKHQAQVAQAKSASDAANVSSGNTHKFETANAHAQAAQHHRIAELEHKKAANLSEGETKKHHEFTSWHHGNMAETHENSAKELKAKGIVSRNDIKEPLAASDATADEAVTARATGDVVHCRAASDILGSVSASEKPWKQGVETRHEFIPAGTHTICAGFRANSILLTIEIDPERDTPVVQGSFQKLVSKYPKQKPFGCIEHEEKDASIWAKGFAPTATGIDIIHEPSALGENHVNGRIHRSWSPSFLTDADYTKATLKEYPSGKVYEFPAGVRGSEQNPARITGVTFCVGTLTNNPAFKEINPVRAKEMAITMNIEKGNDADKVTAGAPVGNKNAAGHHGGFKPRYASDTPKIQIRDSIEDSHAKSQIGKHAYFYHAALSKLDQPHVPREESKDPTDLLGGKEGNDHTEIAKEAKYHMEQMHYWAGVSAKEDGAKATSATPQPDAVRATWSDAAREAAKEAKSAKAAGYHRKAMDSEDGITRTAHYASANAHESGSVQMHKVAESVHRQARDYHLDAGNQEQAQEHEFHRAQHSSHAAAPAAKVTATARTVTSILGEPSRVDAILAAKPKTEAAAPVKRTAADILKK